MSVKIPQITEFLNQGDTWTFPITVVDASGKPVDLTGQKMGLTVKQPWHRKTMLTPSTKRTWLATPPEQLSLWPTDLTPLLLELDRFPGVVFDRDSDVSRRQFDIRFKIVVGHF